jgi:hypothetical protein
MESKSKIGGRRLKLKDLKDAFVTIGTTISLAAGAMLFFIGRPLYVLAEQALFYDDYEGYNDVTLSNLAASQQELEQLLLLEDQKSTRETQVAG